MINELFRISDEAGVIVEYCRLPLNKSASAFDEDGNFILMDYSLLSSPTNEVIHFAHELGHCMTGSFYNPYSKLDVREKHEYRASRWSYEHLLPYDKLLSAVADGLTEIWQISEHFGLPDEFVSKVIAYYQDQQISA